MDTLTCEACGYTTIVRDADKILTVVTGLDRPERYSTRRADLHGDSPTTHSRSGVYCGRMHASPAADKAGDS